MDDQPETYRKPPCFVCRKPFPAWEGVAQPGGGCEFSTDPCYGSRYDRSLGEMERISLFICDDCMQARQDDLSLYRAGYRRGDLQPWSPEYHAEEPASLKLCGRAGDAARINGAIADWTDLYIQMNHEGPVPHWVPWLIDRLRGGTAISLVREFYDLASQRDDLEDLLATTRAELHRVSQDRPAISAYIERRATAELDKCAEPGKIPSTAWLDAWHALRQIAVEIREGKHLTSGWPRERDESRAAPGYKVTPVGANGWRFERLDEYDEGFDTEAQAIGRTWECYDDLHGYASYVEDALGERDAAHNLVDKIRALMGIESEWSNLYGYSEFLMEVQDVLAIKTGEGHHDLVKRIADLSPQDVRELVRRMDDGTLHAAIVREAIGSAEKRYYVVGEGWIDTERLVELAAEVSSGGGLRVIALEVREPTEPGDTMWTCWYRGRPSHATTRDESIFYAGWWSGRRELAVSVQTLADEGVGAKVVTHRDGAGKTEG